MSAERRELGPGGLGLRVAAVQAFLAGACWLVLGYWNARAVLLLEPAQQGALPAFFWRYLPFFGLVIVVFLPALWVYRIADEATLDVKHETAFVARVFALPRQMAVLDMGASVLIFLLGALQLRFRYDVPAIEAAKIEVLGFLTGVPLGILSYFLLTPILRPVAVAAMRGGAEPPDRPGFRVTEKIEASLLAIALVVLGAMGEISLAWGQRFAEARAGERSSALLRRWSADAETLGLRDAAGWSRYLAGKAPAGTTLLVLDPFGRKIAVAPAIPAGPDRQIVASDELREQIARQPVESTVLRRGTARVASRALLRGGWRLIALAPPDTEIIRQLLRSLAAVGIEVLALSALLAWSVGRGVTAPLRALEDRTRRFAAQPESLTNENWPTDDEIGALSRSFSAMEGEILGMQATLRESERRAATSELLAGVAHEVRNPLFGLTSTLAALERDLGGDPRFGEHFGVLRRESARLSRMMEEFLTMRRRPRLSGGAVALAEVIAGAGKRVRARFEDRDVEIAVEGDPEARLEEGDADRLGDVFVNLFENAVLATAGAARIRVTARCLGPELEIQVEDAGDGISPELRERIFEPFVSRRTGGTGLGLALCRQIVEEHGGTITLASAAGEPTRFSVRLPVVRGRREGV
jgi:signal transduction histidine kinase